MSSHLSSIEKKIIWDYFSLESEAFLQKYKGHALTNKSQPLKKFKKVDHLIEDANFILIPNGEINYLFPNKHIFSEYENHHEGQNPIFDISKEDHHYYFQDIFNIHQTKYPDIENANKYGYKYWTFFEIPTIEVDDSDEDIYELENMGIIDVTSNQSIKSKYLLTVEKPEDKTNIPPVEKPEDKTNTPPSENSDDIINKTIVQLDHKLGKVTKEENDIIKDLKHLINGSDNFNISDFIIKYNHFVDEVTVKKGETKFTEYDHLEDTNKLFIVNNRYLVLDILDQHNNYELISQFYFSSIPNIQTVYLNQISRLAQVVKVDDGWKFKEKGIIIADKKNHSIASAKVKAAHKNSDKIEDQLQHNNTNTIEDPEQQSEHIYIDIEDSTGDNPAFIKKTNGDYYITKKKNNEFNLFLNPVLNVKYNKETEELFNFKNCEQGKSYSPLDIEIKPAILNYDDRGYALKQKGIIKLKG